MALAGTIGYATAAGAYLLLSVLLMVAWEGRGGGARLILAAAVTAAWGGWLAALSLHSVPALLPVALAEAVRNGAWLVVLAQLAGTGRLHRGLVRFAYALSCAVLVLLPLAGILLPGSLQTLMTVSGLALPLVGLLLLEQIYRSSETNGRWALFYLYVGVGGLFVYDVFLYAQGLLLGGLSQDAWMARGYVAALAVPFIAVSARRNVAWSLDLFVSRDVVFHTTTLFVVGAYFLVMALGGYVVRLAGGTWGVVGQIIFLAAAVALLAALIGSTGLKNRIRVLLVKHFYRNKYDYREEWLRFISTLSGGADDEPAPVTAVRAVAQIVDSPGGALICREEEEQDWRLEAGWPIEALLDEDDRGTLLSSVLPDWLRRREWVIDLAEYREDPEAYPGLDLPDRLVAGRSWRLVVPVMLRSQLYGILLLQEPRSGFEMTFEDRDLLRTAARHIATHVAQYRSDRRLAEHREFAAFNKLSAFMMHDLKNAVAQLDLVVSNAARHSGNPEFIRDAINTVSGVSRRIAGLIETLRHGDRANKAELVRLDGVIDLAVQRSCSRLPHPSLTGEPMPAVCVEASGEQLVNVVEHVIRNAQEAAGPAGRVDLRISPQGMFSRVEVRDDGPGMTAEFVRDRLFRPFDSTKGSKGMGLGAYQAREYIRSIGGRIEVETAPGSGTCFAMILPVSRPAGRSEEAA